MMQLLAMAGIRMMGEEVCDMAQLFGLRKEAVLLPLLHPSDERKTWVCCEEYARYCMLRREGKLVVVEMDE